MIALASCRCPLKQGRYLVVCRGEEIYSSGLVLISPLEIETHFDAATNLVQVFVKDTSVGKYVSDAQVRLLQGGNGQAQTLTVGATDLRGVFAGPLPTTNATIVVRSAAGGYGFVTHEVAAPGTQNVATQTRQSNGVPSINGENDPTAPFRGHSSRTHAELPVVVAAEEESAFPTNLALKVDQSQTSHEGLNASASLNGADDTSEQRIRLSSPVADDARIRRHAAQGSCRLPQGFASH